MKEIQNRPCIYTNIKRIYETICQGFESKSTLFGLFFRKSSRQTTVVLLPTILFRDIKQQIVTQPSWLIEFSTRCSSWVPQKLCFLHPLGWRVKLMQKASCISLFSLFKTFPILSVTREIKDKYALATINCFMKNCCRF